MRADPKSVKKTVKLLVFFALLGSDCAKAARKTLMNLTPCDHRSNEYRGILKRE